MCLNIVNDFGCKRGSDRASYNMAEETWSLEPGLVDQPY